MRVVVYLGVDLIHNVDAFLGVLTGELRKDVLINDDVLVATVVVFELI